MKTSGLGQGVGRGQINRLRWRKNSLEATGGSAEGSEPPNERLVRTTRGADAFLIRLLRTADCAVDTHSCPDTVSSSANSRMLFSTHDDAPSLAPDRTKRLKINMVTPSFCIAFTRFCGTLIVLLSITAVRGKRFRGEREMLKTPGPAPSVSSIRAARGFWRPCDQIFLCWCKSPAPHRVG